MRNNNGYRKLIAWQKSNLLAHLIYDITIQFPKDELFGLISQMRRAALSVCANIAEGYSRSSLKDRKHFYQMATASLTLAKPTAAENIAKKIYSLVENKT